MTEPSEESELGEGRLSRRRLLTGKFDDAMATTVSSGAMWGASLVALFLLRTKVEDGLDSIDKHVNGASPKQKIVSDAIKATFADIYASDTLAGIPYHDVYAITTLYINNLEREISSIPEVASLALGASVGATAQWLTNKSIESGMNKYVRNPDCSRRGFMKGLIAALAALGYVPSVISTAAAGFEVGGQVGNIAQKHLTEFKPNVKQILDGETAYFETVDMLGKRTFPESIPPEITRPVLDIFQAHFRENLLQYTREQQQNSQQAQL